MNASTKQNWYALYTTARSEKRVAEQLTKSNVNCWLPIHKSRRVWSDRTKLIEEPLFRSYIFVYCEEHQLREFFSISGVVKAVFYDGKPAIIPQHEIDAIKEFLVLAENKTLCKNDEIQIVCGVMKNVYGKVQRVMKNYLILKLETLGATVCVKADTVEKITKK